ncbi:hypothetical protein FHY04_004296 [Sphingomonas sp. BK481]|nr:hypothetical protein [Sphingomonas sp. BK481]
MSQATLDAWISLYAAVGLLVAMCAIIAGIKTVHDYRSGTRTLATTTVMDKVLAVIPAFGFVGSSITCSVRRRYSRSPCFTPITSGSRRSSTCS